MCLFHQVVELLLTRGANKEHRNVSDYTPLSLAASGGYVNIIKLLLAHGAEINSRTGSKLGISPLMLAAMNGHTGKYHFCALLYEILTSVTFKPRFDARFCSTPVCGHVCRVWNFNNPFLSATGLCCRLWVLVVLKQINDCLLYLAQRNFVSMTDGFCHRFSILMISSLSLASINGYRKIAKWTCNNLGCKNNVILCMS